MDPIVKVENLTKRYKKSRELAVDSISFTVTAGSFFTFLGPNGAGKTTTISILTTTLVKTSGFVSIAGFNLDRNQKEIRKNIGIIFQNPSLDLNLTAEENIRFHACLYGLYRFSPFYATMPQDYKNRISELAEVLEIQNDIFKPIRTFSGGMKRKLEIVRSLIHHPKILFLDEPTVGLDPVSRNNLWRYLKTVRQQEKTTIFLTTHYLDEAEESDRVCIINKGKIVVNGTPSDIKSKLVKDYIEVDSNLKESLRNELNSLSVNYLEEDHFKIFVPQTLIQSVIQSIKTPLTFLKIHNPSLEEAYLEVIENGRTE
jgi:ABC-2 type transport system ATP-binding protein